MKIRKYQKKYDSQTKKLIINVFVEFFGRNIIAEWEKFNDYAVMYLAEDNGKLVACAALKDDGEGIGKLKRMYILENYRGKGLGKKLFNKILEKAKDKKMKILRISTVPEMKGAITFYKKHGFKMMNNVNVEQKFPELKHEDVKDTIFMEKKLN